MQNKKTTGHGVQSGSFRAVCGVRRRPLHGPLAVLPEHQRAREGFGSRWRYSWWWGEEFTFWLLARVSILFLTHFLRGGLLEIATVVLVDHSMLFAYLARGCCIFWVVTSAPAGVHGGLVAPRFYFLTDSWMSGLGTGVSRLFLLLRNQAHVAWNPAGTHLAIGHAGTGFPNHWAATIVGRDESYSGIKLRSDKHTK